LLKLYGDKLKREGFEVIFSTTGEDGVTKAILEKPDLVILDLVLPRKHGFEVLSEIKLDSTIKDMPVIILSSLGQENDVKRGLELGAMAYMIKTDFSINQLGEIVRGCLVKARGRVKTKKTRAKERRGQKKKTKNKE